MGSEQDQVIAELGKSAVEVHRDLLAGIVIHAIARGLQLSGDGVGERWHRRIDAQLIDDRGTQHVRALIACQEEHEVTHHCCDGDHGCG